MVDSEADFNSLFPDLGRPDRELEALEWDGPKLSLRFGVEFGNAESMGSWFSSESVPGVVSVGVPGVDVEVVVSL